MCKIRKKKNWKYILPCSNYSWNKSDKLISTSEKSYSKGIKISDIIKI